MGNVLVLVGSLTYAFVRDQENQQNRLSAHIRSRDAENPPVHCTASSVFVCFLGFVAYFSCVLQADTRGRMSIAVTGESATRQQESPVGEGGRLLIQIDKDTSHGANTDGVIMNGVSHGHVLVAGPTSRHSPHTSFSRVDVSRTQPP